MVTYLRVKGDPRANPGRVFEPLPDDHPAVAGVYLCPGCGEPLRAGDVTTLVPIGPGDDAEVRERCREGRWYNAVALVVHRACVDGVESDD